LKQAAPPKVRNCEANSLLLVTWPALFPLLAFGAAEQETVARAMRSKIGRKDPEVTT